MVNGIRSNRTRIVSAMTPRPKLLKRILVKTNRIFRMG
jgi:hypothetical protein